MKFHLTIVLFSILKFSFSQDSTAFELSELSVTANIINTEIKNTGRNITVIDRKMIEGSPVKTLEGVLQYALNVDVRSRSAFGVQADISIRGGHYDQTLILVDGIKVNDPQTGHHSLNIPVPFSMIDRIEILQGGTSRVFGPSAFSGVINIITKKINKNSSPEMSTRLKYIITSVGGNKDPKDIRSFVDQQLLARDSRALREYIKEVQPDVDLTFFPEGSNEKVAIPVGLSFFWPDI
jgi:outer membrane cobalamin receptor